MAQGGRYFMAADGWQRYRHDRRRRLLMVLSILLGLAGLGFAIASYAH